MFAILSQSQFVGLVHLNQMGHFVAFEKNWRYELGPFLSSIYMFTCMKEIN